MVVVHCCTDETPRVFPFGSEDFNGVTKKMIAAKTSEIRLNRNVVGISKEFASANPLASSLADCLSSRQLIHARKTARWAGVNADNVSLEMFDCYLSELSRSAAEYLIEYLESMVNSPRSAAALRKAG